MLVHVPTVLGPDELSSCRAIMARAEWEDGRATAGLQSAQVKDNQQIREGSADARALADAVLTALERHPLFISAALPLKVFPPLFNRYAGGQSFGSHVDNAIRQVPNTPHRVRTDLSATLFLSPPEDYDGGELVVEDTYGVHSVKLPPGDMILYPSGSLHHVRPVPRGARLAAVFWVQSMVRDDGERTILFDLDSAIRGLRSTGGDSAVAVRLTAIYHNLLRRWADA